MKSCRGSSQVLLLVLLLVVAVAGYLYYFTDLIRPKEEGQKPVPVESPQVKMPMPARQTPISSAQPTQPAKGVKPPPAQVKPSQPQTSKPLAAPAPSKAAPKPLPPQPAPAPNGPSTAAKGPKQQTVPTPPQVEREKPTKQPKPTEAGKGKYTVLVGTYVLETKLDEDKARVKKSGLVPVVKKGGTKRVTMNRLFVASFTDNKKAESELDKLKKVIDSAFLLKEKGKYSLYAGSYYLERTALQEQERLNNVGMTLVLKKADVAVPAMRLTAGHYSSKQAARNAIAALRKRGLAATVVSAKD